MFITEIRKDSWPSKKAKRLIRYTVSSSCLGYYFLAETEGKICALHILGSNKAEKALKQTKNNWRDAEFEENKELGGKYDSIINQVINGESKSLPNIILKGTAFQLKTWKALLNIPYGSTMTYGEVSKKIKNPNASRAVGQAVGANPVAVLVPCHRVLPSNGSIGGYAWGPSVKSKLLEIENGR